MHIVNIEASFILRFFSSFFSSSHLCSVARPLFPILFFLVGVATQFADNWSSPWWEASKTGESTILTIISKSKEKIFILLWHFFSTFIAAIGNYNSCFVLAIVRFCIQMGLFETETSPECRGITARMYNICVLFVNIYMHNNIYVIFVNICSVFITACYIKFVYLYSLHDSPCVCYLCEYIQWRFKTVYIKRI